MFILYLISFLAVIYYFSDGYSYYSTPLPDRPHHADFRNLKPGGLRAHGFGVIGSGMLVLLLLYSLRKRIRFMHNAGNIARWLNLHIYLGITGPLLIILHSSFKLNGLISMSFWSMIAVALSGVLGRYLYTQIPRTIQGKEITFDELNNQFEELSKEIQDNYNLDTSEVKEIIIAAGFSKPEETNLFVAFFSMISSGLVMRLQTRRLKRILKSNNRIGQSHIGPLIILFKKISLLQRRITFWHTIHRLFHYWHVFHKPFAIIMYLIMLVHIIIVVWLGYTWIF